jgi:pyruvate/2-oxoglutarate dehydrogenase complex dihydrolipoamide acyltransferase (E2) component
MTEGLFILTTLIVAYVIYVIMNEKKAGGTPTKPAMPATQSGQQAQASAAPKAKAAAPKPKPVVAKATAKAAPKPAVVKATAPAPKPIAPKPATAVKPAAKKPAEITVVATAAGPIKGSGLKDPKTGEVTTAYSNYRFTKRWIKEALVAEKLVEKVYKNDELNQDIEGKIKAGILKLEGMKKYKP